MIEIVPLESSHIEKIYDSLEKIPISKMDYITAALSPGSLAYAAIQDGTIVACGGIVNIGWNRGEAWLLITPQFKSCIKSVYGFMRKLLPQMAKSGKYRRVQATTWNNSSLFKHLGFSVEGLLLCYGPNGEDTLMYSRIFGE